MNTVEFISKLEASGMPVEQAKVVAERFEDDSLVTTKVLEASLDRQFIKIGGLICVALAPVYSKVLGLF